jgi:hypothetical protein
MREIYEERTGGDPSLLDSFVVYMDVLGTDSALDKAQKKGGQALDAYFREFRGAWLEATRVAGTSDPDWVKATAFSDLMFVALPVRDDGEAELQSVFTTASLFQFFLAIKGFFVRGGLARGPAWVTSGFSFGPALADAYKVESRQATYPRIVLTQPVRDAIHSYMSYYNNQVAMTPQHHSVRVDRAGVMFVDYLQHVFVTPDPSQQVEAVEDHRQAVISELFETMHDPSANDKLQWARRYHNHFVTSNFPKRQDLLIEELDPVLEFMSLREYYDAGGKP